MFQIEPANNIKRLPQYIFGHLATLRDKKDKEGIKIIDLSVGDPDFPTPKNIVEEMKEQLDIESNHKYPSFQGEKKLRESVAKWYKKNYEVDLDPDDEVLILLGSKEGLAHMPMVFLNDDDIAIIPDPAYPAYLSSVKISEGMPYIAPLLAENNFLPDLSKIPSRVREKSKLFYINYPNNPTSALATDDFYEELVEFASKNNIIVCSDFAYSEIVFDNRKAKSFLSTNGAKEIGVEFHSFSKTFAMTGWRLGFVAGNKTVIKHLGSLKKCMDSGVFKAVQFAGIEALEGNSDIFDLMMEEYQKRRDIFAEGLGRLGWEFNVPESTYYFWIKIPNKFNLSSIEFAEYLVNEIGVLVMPGVGFGEYGAGYFRIAINVSIDKLSDVIKRFGEI